MADIVGGTANGASLASIGISLQVDGTLKVDSGKLASALGDGGKQAKAHEALHAASWRKGRILMTCM